MLERLERHGNFFPAARDIRHHRRADQCELSGEKIKSGRLEKYEWEQLEYKIKDLYGAPIYVDDPDTPGNSTGVRQKRLPTRTRRIDAACRRQTH